MVPTVAAAITSRPAHQYERIASEMPSSMRAVNGSE